MNGNWAAHQIVGARFEQQDSWAVLSVHQGVGRLFGPGVERELDADGLPDQVVAIVADGVGGSRFGGVAADLAVEAFAEAYCGFGWNWKEPSFALRKAVGLANQSIANFKLYKRLGGNPDYEQMSTTLVAVCMLEREASLFWISVGDSPLWLRRADGKLRRLNQRHTMGWLADHIKPGRVETAEPRVTIASASGSETLVSTLAGQRIRHIDAGQWPGRLPDSALVLIASDGLESLSCQELEVELAGQLLEYGSENSVLAGGVAYLDGVCKSLIATAETAGGGEQDNTTLVLLA